MPQFEANFGLLRAMLQPVLVRIIIIFFIKSFSLNTMMVFGAILGSRGPFKQFWDYIKKVILEIYFYNG